MKNPINVPQPAYGQQHSSTTALVVAAINTRSSRKQSEVLGPVLSRNAALAIVGVT